MRGVTDNSFVGKIRVMFFILFPSERLTEAADAFLRSIAIFVE